jgi:hypothetical protein
MVEIAKCNGVGKQYVSRLIRLAFLAPEEARAIVDPVLRLMIAAVHRYGGQVAQSTGDGIFALFGAPVAYEDDPQRALHAALAKQEGLRRGADRLRNEGQDFRRGANRGEHGRGGGADGRDRRQYGIHAGRSCDQSGGTSADRAAGACSKRSSGLYYASRPSLPFAGRRARFRTIPK